MAGRSPEAAGRAWSRPANTASSIEPSPRRAAFKVSRAARKFEGLVNRVTILVACPKAGRRRDSRPGRDGSTRHDAGRRHRRRAAAPTSSRHQSPLASRPWYRSRRRCRPCNAGRRSCGGATGGGGGGSLVANQTGDLQDRPGRTVRLGNRTGREDRHPKRGVLSAGPVSFLPSVGQCSGCRGQRRLAKTSSRHDSSR